MGRLRILVADPNLDIQEAMRQVVKATGADVSLAFAGDGQTALNLALSVRPHLAMMDMGLRHVDALSLVHYLHRRLPETRIIVMLTDDGKEYRFVAQRAGACAVIRKASLNEDWMRAIICLLEDCQGMPEGEQIAVAEPDQPKRC